jgi:hypothetical protein
MNLKFYQITNINDNIKNTPNSINKLKPYGEYILHIIIDLYILDIIVNIDKSSCGKKTSSILISSMPTKVHNEQCLSSTHS